MHLVQHVIITKPTSFSIFNLCITRRQNVLPFQFVHNPRKWLRLLAPFNKDIMMNQLAITQLSVYAIFVALYINLPHFVILLH